MAEPGRIPVPLRLCRACNHFVRIENADCDFCGADLAALETAHEEAQAELRELKAQLHTLLDGAMAAP